MNHIQRIGFLIITLCIIATVIIGISTASLPGTAGKKMTIEDTLSDVGQRTTIAFSGLAFLSGDACSDTFLPPGKVADYAGFQYLRDNDASEMGHNTDFVTRAADNVIYILNETQLANYVALGNTESSLSIQYANMRFPLMKAFRQNLEGTIPSGSSGLNYTAVTEYSAKLYDVDASITLGRAKTYSVVINSLNTTQRAYLDKMKSGGMTTWPVVDVSEKLRKLGQGNSVAMRTYASEMFSWYAGSIEADTYFCPERIATYFGSFYMKDRPAMGNPNYSINTSLTHDSGEAFLALLNSNQSQQITGLVELQKPDLYEIVSVRQAIATELRHGLTGATIDDGVVRSLSARYGRLEGGISYQYATRFADVGKSSTPEQKQKMVVLRNLSQYTCDGAYRYSEPISMPQNIVTDFLFTSGGNALTITGITPTTGQNVTNVTVTITGTNFKSGATVKLVKNAVAKTGTVQQNTGTQIICILPLTGVPAAVYDLVVTNPDGSSGTKSNAFTVTSPVLYRFTMLSAAGVDGGILPKEYTCDGAGYSPSFSWSQVPEGTKEFALMMTTLPVDGSTKWNWLVYRIPASTSGFAQNSTGIGINGMNSHNVLAYSPPCAEGPGAKVYTFTVYALSASPSLPASATQVTGPVLTQAISSITLGSASISLSNSRNENTSPVITGLTPTTGANSGNVSIIITGMNFRNGATVKLVSGTVVKTATVQQITSTKITGILSLTGVSAGAYSLTITNTDGTTGTKLNAFTVMAAGQNPTITGITPSSGLSTQNTQITITGTNFRPGIIVEMSKGMIKKSASVTRCTPANIICTLPTKGLADGLWSITLTNVDQTTVTKVGGFLIKTGTAVKGIEPGAVGGIVLNTPVNGPSFGALPSEGGVSGRGLAPVIAPVMKPGLPVS